MTLNSFTQNKFQKLQISWVVTHLQEVMVIEKVWSQFGSHYNNY